MHSNLRLFGEELLMAYRFEFDSTNRILLCRFAGRVNDEDLKTFYRAAVRWIAILNPRAGITDLSALTSFEVTAETIRTLAKSLPSMPDPSHLLIIVAASAHTFGMARMFEFEGEVKRLNVHVVRTIKEALAILGMQESQFDQFKLIQELPDSPGANFNS
jgi:hypothetical protein